MRYLLSILLFCLPINCLSQSAEVPSNLKGVKRIVCLGDSITQGGEGPGGYVWLVRHYLKTLYPQQNIEVLNVGISEHKSNDMLARFQKDVLDKKPDMVTISVGVNDVWHGFFNFQERKEIPDGNGPNGIPLDAYRRNVLEMVIRAKEAGAKVVILSTTVIYEDLRSAPNVKLVGYNESLREIARKQGAVFVDYQKPFQRLIKAYRDTTGGRDDLLTTDGVHMNALGNRVMAYTLLSGLGIAPEARTKVQGEVEKAQREGR
jgi:lysophospholipase L1-like esterase